MCACHCFLRFSALLFILQWSTTLAGGLTSVVFLLKWFCLRVWSDGIFYFKIFLQQRNGGGALEGLGDLGPNSYSCNQCPWFYFDHFYTSTGSSFFACILGYGYSSMVVSQAFFLSLSHCLRRHRCAFVTLRSLYLFLKHLLSSLTLFKKLPFGHLYLEASPQKTFPHIVYTKTQEWIGNLLPFLISLGFRWTPSPSGSWPKISQYCLRLGPNLSC